MGNPVRGDVELKAGGETYRLRATWDVLANIQDDLGGVPLGDIPSVMQTRMLGGSVRIVPQIIHRLMEGAGFEGTYKDAARIQWDEPMQLPEAIMQAFRRSGFWSDGKADEGEAATKASPPKATSGRRS